MLIFSFHAILLSPEYFVFQSAIIVFNLLQNSSNFEREIETFKSLIYDVLLLSKYNKTHLLFIFVKDKQQFSTTTLILSFFNLSCEKS